VKVLAQPMQNDTDRFAIIREKLFTAVVGDVMDSLGLLQQFLPPEIRPLRDGMIVVGRAMPVLERDLTGDRATKPFGLMLEALDDLRPGEVYVASGGAGQYAMWGELMSTRAQVLGAYGAVLNGLSRDTWGILKLNFPVFSRGRYAQDQAPRGEVVDFRVPVRIGQVEIHPGDIVFGDVDGVLAIPRAAEDEVVGLALEKASKENLVRKAIIEKSTAASAFEKFGVM
jgi:regulator of RNase E activity RraA